MKKSLSIILVLVMLLSMVFTTVTVSAAFSDTSGHWAESVIDKWSDKGVLSGDGDGTFRPDDSITRAEFAKVIVTAKGYTDPTNISYTDVSKNDWYYYSLSLASAAGIINGYDDGTFRPEAQITREEASAIISRAYNLSGSGSINFTDSYQISDWAVSYVAQLCANNIIRGYEDGSFRPQDPITRAETVQILDRVSYEPLPTLEPDNNDDFYMNNMLGSNTSFGGGGSFGGSSGSSGPSVKEETTTINIDTKWLDVNGNEITVDVQNDVSFSNGFKLGENIVSVGKRVSFSENLLEDYELLKITVNDEEVDKIEFTAVKNTIYNIVFTNQAIDTSRRPNDEPIDIGKLQQLTSDGYIDSLIYNDSTVRAIDGNFSTIQVNNESDAALVFNQLSPILGLNNSSNIFTADDIICATTGNGDASRSYYRLNTEIDNIAVFGSDIVLIVDNNGVVDGLHSSYDKRINSVDSTPSITSDDAEAIALESFYDKIYGAISESDLSDNDIKEYAKQIVNSMSVDSELIIYSLNQDLPALAWRVNVYTPTSANNDENNDILLEIGELSDSSLFMPQIDYSYYIYANNIYAGQILKELSNAQYDWIPSTDSAKDANGNERTFSIEINGGSSRLSDIGRNIKTYQTLYENTGGFLGFGETITPVLPGRIITKGLFGWNKKGVSAHYNMSKAYDFYNNNFERRSYDEKGATINTSIEYYNQDYDKDPIKWDVWWLINAFNEENACWSSKNEQFMFYNVGNCETALDTVGHEYTHAVINTTVGGPSLNTTLTYFGETGALNEAYADIMGSFVEGKDRNDSGRWLQGEDTGEACRSFSDPESKECADNYSDFMDSWWINHYKLDEEDAKQVDYGGVHHFCGIVTLAYYKMIMDNDSSCSNVDHNHTSRTSNISDTTWAKVFYNSIYHLQIDAKFVDARMAIINEARAQGFTETQLQAIREAFDDVGVTGSDVYLAEDTFDWTWYEHPDYEFKYMTADNREHSIEIDNNDIQMLGYNVEAYKDFLFMPNNDSNTKIFSFELERDRTDWHSIEGGGFLFNTKIENNTIEGYCILTTQSGLKLVKINQCDLNAFRDGSYNTIQDVGELLTTVDIGDPYARQSYVIIVAPNEIAVWCNGEWVIAQYTLPTVSESYGFGPITSHESHSCSQLSYYTFSNIRMESLR